ncbi:LysR family transcriptional regulator [Agarivorans sp. Alg241-V36]|uniref:LysR family transcriptional regulator n=1 Tax=Agarivorans sp. Alg241-V36 TaxID=2305992 RepID=UPI0013D066AB|nr:LysR family transcriptional regulator [Agarivorans sp. Alg241-V36]
MSVTFEQLKSMVVFAQVVEQGSFSAAAKHIGITRAVVSYHVKKLEKHLGLSLLNRSTRSLHLTEAGEQYYQRCHNIAEQAKAANLQIENLKQEPEGSLKISCPVNAGLQTIVPAINEFRRLYPKVNIDLVLSDEVVNIIQDGFDLAIRGAALNDSGLQAAKLTTLSTCLCGAPEYLNKYGRPQKPADLDAHQWVIYTAGSSTLQLSKGSRSFSIKTKGGMSTNNAAVRTAFVEGGHGLGRVPLYDALPKINAGKLEIVMPDYALQDIDVYCVFPKGAASSKKLRLLIDYLKQNLAKQESLRAR